MATPKEYKNNNGQKRYRIQVYLGTDPLTGKRVKTTINDCKTQKEAQQKAMQAKIAFENGTYQKQSLETFQDVYNEWIKEYEGTVAESTFVKTSGIFKNHILPKFGEYRMEKIDAKICEKHVKEWKEKLQRFKMVQSYCSLVFDYAIKEKIISRNVMREVKITKKKIDAIKLDELENERIEENFYTKEQLIHFLKCLEQEPNYKAYALFRLLSYSGMRKGEALALVWNDINFKTKEIRINKALSRGKDNRLYIKTTKNESSIRNIKMDQETLDILQEWKVRQKRDYLKLGYNTLKPNQLVFSNENNNFLQPTKTRKWILHVQNKYGLKKISTHGLRHTHCSILFESGAKPKEVQVRLGHSDIKTTMNIYTHVTDEANEEVVDKMVNHMDK